MPVFCWQGLALLGFLWATPSSGDHGTAAEHFPHVTQGARREEVGASSAPSGVNGGVASAADMPGHENLNLKAPWKRPPRGTPAHLNCTAKKFIDIALSSVAKMLNLAGTRSLGNSTLSFHFDAGRSQPEGGSREVPRADLPFNIFSAVTSNCSAAQVRSCAHAMGNVASLEGLGDFLTDALEHGVARPTPERTTGFGFGSVAGSVLAGPEDAAVISGSKQRKGLLRGLDSALQELSVAVDIQASADELLGKSREVVQVRDSLNDVASQTTSRPSNLGLLQVGGGSGAGFQVLCGDKTIASLGGGGGGGAAGVFGAGARRPIGNESIGGGGGGGTQLFFPASLNHTPWESGRWLSWSTGGGSGCGTCKADDEVAACTPEEVEPYGIHCGARMDDTGAVDAAAGLKTAHFWRVGVLKPCFEAGKLRIIGGGGGGSGGAECCSKVPTLNFGFGFHAELLPTDFEELDSRMSRFRHRSASRSRSEGCCPALDRWNITKEGNGRGDVHAVPRRLAEINSRAGEQLYVVDPFGREHGAEFAGNGENRRPELEEMIAQHAQRLGTDASAILQRTSNASCSLPPWLNGTNITMLALPKEGESLGVGNSKTKEPAQALKYIFKFNPLQGFLAQGAAHCGGWADWCCLCHKAQWDIACAPHDFRHKVEWFLTEDCCESKMQKNKSSAGYVVEASPERTGSVVWKPGVGWVSIPKTNSTAPDAVRDSYSWDGNLGRRPACRMMDVIEEPLPVTTGPPNADALPVRPPVLGPSMRGEQSGASTELAAAAAVGSSTSTASEARSSMAEVAADVGMIGMVVLLAMPVALARLLPRLRSAGQRLRVPPEDARTIAARASEGFPADDSPGYTEMVDVES
eukprot:TRINITY_DN124088_c0_g1_i1.p1 TRINITY_DN124088_c0_g1~~TRINITY_DN124088_c0_g1_i1.p1  ORF type:complete len:864 (-),score=157.16 TRINITY_DN124088_c0_g1_i1:276-2867(-)